MFIFLLCSSLGKRARSEKPPSEGKEAKWDNFGKQLVSMENMGSSYIQQRLGPKPGYCFYLKNLRDLLHATGSPTSHADGRCSNYTIFNSQNELKVAY